MQATGELVAGQELDALVAEKVMGWHRRPIREVIAIYAKGGPWDGLTNQWYSADNTEVAWADGDSPWSPSTDIGAAWEVVERVAEHVPNEFMLWQEHGQWAAEFQSGTTAFAKTASLAICLAALKSVSA